MNKSPYTIALSLLLFTTGLRVSFQNSSPQVRKKSSRGVASVQKQTKKIFLGVDGLSRENFDYAREKLGLFKMFKQVSSHVAPFPSISDYSWNILMHARDVNGPRGAIGYYEGVYYDYRKNNLMDDPREYFRRIGSSDHYFNGFFDFYLNPYIEALLYFPTEELPKLELRQLEESILETGAKSPVTAMVASVDALAHTRENSMDFLKDLDGFLTNIQRSFKAKGISAEIILVSDHGQASRSKPGEEVLPLLPIDLKPVFAKAGVKQSKSLEDSSDVIIPVMALGNYITVTFKDLEKRKGFVEALKEETWFEQAIYVEKAEEYNPAHLSIIISDRSGDARLEVFDFPKSPTYEYTPLTGNPLQVPEEIFKSTISDEEARAITSKTRYPDSFFRLAQMAKQDEAEMPDLIFTTIDSHRVSGQFDKMTSMFLTHGSLSKRSSLGIFATTSDSRAMIPEIRTHEILSYAEINPKEISKSKGKGFNSNPEDTFTLLQSSGYKGIETGAGSYSNERIFGIINNAVNYSRYVFDIPTIEKVGDVFKPILEKFGDVAPHDKKVGDLEMDLSKVEIDKALGPKDFGLITDLILKHGDLEKIQKDPRFIALKERVQGILPKQSGPDMTVDGVTKKGSPYTRAAKRITMKGYSSTFLLEKALTMPEFPTMEDKRDLTFWKDWNQNGKSIALNAEHLSKNTKTVQKLFNEIFLEQKYAEDIAPLGMPLLYNKLPKGQKDLTIVYVPGIYNSIFDNEIFQIGLDAIRFNMGIRVLEAPVFSACSSDYNSDIILETLKKDIEYRKGKNQSPQKYLILGYSKGGVDSLHALAKEEPKFIEENISGLVTIASPLAGSSILNKTDLPVTLLELLASERIPDACKEDQKAAGSITPAAAQLFMQKNLSKLVGLTRYYSLSFKANIKDSHLFMKATKDIAGFTEENDGVVTVSSSKFPASLGAIDLGTIEADHLAGIVASKFPQTAFMQSLVLTLAELKAFDSENNAKYNDYIRYNSKDVDSDFHKNKLAGLLGDKKTIDKKLTTLKSISESEKIVIAKKIEEQIKTAVKDTPYDLKDFAVNVTKEGKVEVVFAKPAEDYKYMYFWKTKDAVEVNDADQLVKVLLTKLQRSGKNLLAANVELWRTYPVSDRKPFAMPANQLGFNPDFRINLRELDKYIKGKSVTPITQETHPDGIKIVYDHRRVIDFRNEYQLNYESASPLGADESENSGWQTTLDESGKIQAKLASSNSSIRLTTYSMRFKPKDFSKITMNLKVNKSVPGANVLFGGTGKDDSAFQVWFSIRELKPNTDRTQMSTSDKTVLFGYYFGDQVPGTDIKVDQVYENYYSKKNFIIAVLPEAKQIPIGVSPDDLKKPISVTKPLLEDLRRSFPDINPENLEIVGITIQHDSNDVKGSSEAFFKEISFTP